MSQLLGRTKGIIQLRNGYPGLGMKRKQSRGRPVPQRRRLLTPVQLDRTRGKRDKPVVAETVVVEIVAAVAFVAAVESTEQWLVGSVLERHLP